MGFLLAILATVAAVTVVALNSIPTFLDLFPSGYDMGFLLSILAAVAALAALALNGIPPFIELFPSGYDAERTMRAIVYDSHSEDPSTMRLDESFPRPLLRKNQVMVKVAAASINPVDFKIRRNPVPNFLVPLPKIPGMDVCPMFSSLPMYDFCLCAENCFLTLSSSWPPWSDFGCHR